MVWRAMTAFPCALKLLPLDICTVHGREGG